MMRSTVVRDYWWLLIFICVMLTLLVLLSAFRTWLAI